MRVQMLAPAVLLILSTTPAMVLSQIGGAPETFTAEILALGAKGGAASATLEINVLRYTPDADRVAVETALKSGSYPAFLPPFDRPRRWARSSSRMKSGRFDGRASGRP